MIDHKKLESAYREACFGYDEPDYAQIQLSSFREMFKNERGETITLFLAQCEADKIPENAIIVMSKGQPLSVLVDENGHLLTFA